MWSIVILTSVFALIMISAAFYDLRTREIPDIHWVACGAVGTLMSCISFSGSGVSALFLVAGSILTAYLVWERLDGLLGYACLALASLLYAVTYPAVGFHAFVTPAVTVMVLGMYAFGIVRGGADAKALVCMAIAFPVYPEIPGLPLLWDPVAGLDVALSIPLAVLAVGCLLSLLPALCIGVRNLVRGDVSRRMFSSYEMDVEAAENGFVWPVEDIVGGKLKPCGVPDDPTKVYHRLKKKGVTRVRVTPMVPFVLPLTAALLFVLVLGNPMFALV